MNDDNHNFVPFNYLAHDIYNAACRICLELDTYKPDLIIGLAHAGWMPVVASRYLWDVSRKSKFPCHYPINFGQEKRQYARLKRGIDPDVRGVDDVEINQIQKLIIKRREWIREFRILLSKNYLSSTPPNRLLIVDDCVFSGRTAIMAITLAKASIPDAEIRFISPQIKNWRQSFARVWLRRKKKKISELKFQDYDYLKWEALNTLVSSTEDVDPSSLYLKRVSATSQLFEYLKDEEISINEWLELPSWVNTTIESIILRLEKSTGCFTQDREVIYSKHILVTTGN